MVASAGETTMLVSGPAFTKSVAVAVIEPPYVPVTVCAPGTVAEQEFPLQMRVFISENKKKFVWENGGCESHE